ncbi:hypothetical protein HAX54_041250 [Datura stramonium]|uniref:Ubiquitin-like protease family profile domain-containing protein n=1 Tax=Datura stramonium TaxID=4076 RepID=A0ABS8VNT1_DATST|nr:hypothetical protein [Datura stramonium]
MWGVVCGLIIYKSATGGPLVLLHESPVILRISLPNTAGWHQSVEHQRFADQGRRFSSGALESLMFIPVYNIMSISPQSHNGQASMHTNNTQVRFGLERMEEYYIAFKEKSSINSEAQFEVDSFKNAFPDIYDQVGMRDCGLFTLLVYPYFPEFVWEFCASYRARHNSKSTSVTQKHYHAYLRTVQANSVITLATKTDKDALDMKRGKCTENKTPPPPLASSHTSDVQLDTTAIPTPTPPDLLKVAQRAQPARDKLQSLWSTVEVLDSEVSTLRKEVAALSGPPSTNNPIPPEPAMVPAQPKTPKSPLDDWWVGYDKGQK